MTRSVKFRRLLPNVLSVALMTAAFSTTSADIHKCTDEHGNVAYLQLPCPTEKAKVTDTTDKAEVTTAEPEQREDVDDQAPESPVSAPKSPSTRRPGEQLDECKKRYRDQIDEIDAEIRKSYTPSQGASYKKRLLALTQQLRACG